MALRLTLAVCLLEVAAGTCGAQPSSRPAAETRAPATAAKPAPCRITALATQPSLFTNEDGQVSSEAATAADPAEYVERFFVAVECGPPRTAGDYQIWWKPTLSSPPNSARLVAIVDDQAESCDRPFGCFPAGTEFDFAIEVNRWRMALGCYGVKGIFGDAVDEYWQCTRPVVFTLQKNGAEK